jgi:AcrR family transcriptional regulator
MTSAESPTGTRRRAPGMSPEQRRAMIVSAALPLVAEHGAKVTTAQVARVAGIGEATIFRVFQDKDELLDAVVAETLRHEHVVREISSIPLDQPLAARLAEATEALGAHFARLGAIFGALHASGDHRIRRPADKPGPDRRSENLAGARETSMKAIRAAIAELFEPEEATLRLPVEQAATLFLGLLFSRSRPGAPAELSTEVLVDTFLYGAVAPQDGER